MNIIVLMFPFLLAFNFIHQNKMDNNPVRLKAEPSVHIIQQWDLPKELKEVSGISWIDETHLACIMDERGIVFIYNLDKKEIVRKIEFDGGGDYEGLAVVNKDMFTIRSNGIINQIRNYRNEKPFVKSYHTWIKKKSNAEALCYDKFSNQLRVILKGKDPHVKNGRGIYHISLKNKKLHRKPDHILTFSDTNWIRIAGTSVFQPSEMAIHPLTGEMYIIDGENPRLLVINRKGELKKMIQLDKNDFNLPEGITFSPDGKMYISNEGKLLGRGNILQVELR